MQERERDNVSRNRESLRDGLFFSDVPLRSKLDQRFFYHSYTLRCFYSKSDLVYNLSFTKNAKTCLLLARLPRL